MRCIAMLLVKRSPSNGFNQTIMIEGEEGKRKERAGKITSDRMGRELAINWVGGEGIGGWNIFPYFHQHIFHADAQMALTCAAKQRSRFSLFPIFLLFFFFLFWFACTMEEEALKTAKSSAAAANKYAIFLLSCLSGCQPFFAVLRRSSPLQPAPGLSQSAPDPQTRRPGPGTKPAADSSCRIQVGFKQQNGANKKFKQSVGRISMQFDVCVHLLLLLLYCLLPLLLRLLHFFTYSFWLNFNLIAVFCELWVGNIG